MKYILIAIGALLIIWASFQIAKKTTLQSLRDQKAVFDTFQTTKSGWLYSETIGSNAASGVERARVALSGPLGLSSKEVIYFIAQADNDGNRLSSSCDYRVLGQSLDTRWWSLTLYDSKTEKYVPNSINRSSWNNENIVRDEAENWIINVSGKPQNGNWLPSQSENRLEYELMLRLYNPSDTLRKALPNITLPQVERLSCS